MKVIKHINNNFAVALDSLGNQVIVQGKGIGFGQIPREINLSQIERTYYGIDDIYISAINDIPRDVLDVANAIVDKARTTLGNPLNSNIVFTLADHINFSIKRMEKHTHMKLPIVYDVKGLFEKEYQIGLYGIKLIWKKLKVYLPKDEAAYIALHIINAEEQEKNRIDLTNEWIDSIVEIIENDFNLRINREQFNYSRFATHMHYLLKRGRSPLLQSKENAVMYEKFKDEYPHCQECAEKISIFIKTAAGILLTDEEKLFLMIHINRLCAREDCDQ
jgi:beta-glucoside operon transcriptional antiterminator